MTAPTQDGEHAKHASQPQLNRRFLILAARSSVFAVTLEQSPLRRSRNRTARPDGARLNT